MSVTYKPKRRKHPAQKHDPATAIPRSLAMMPAAVVRSAVAAREKRIEKLKLHSFQLPVFRDNKTGILILHWGRQIGKSYVLAAWAVQRAMDRPGRLITLLSNSRENGAEFLTKVVHVCKLYEQEYEAVDESLTLDFEAMRMEVRIHDKGKTSRIKVLAANPRTARGFSGDLILDEFAFHEDAAAIWEAAEPILASNKDFLCRIASTGNGRENLFYRMVQGRVSREEGEGSEGAEKEDRETSNIEHRTLNIESEEGVGPEADAPNHQPSTLQPSTEFYTSAAGFRVSKVPRSFAYAEGLKIFDAVSREEIRPELARERALDKRAYDQNYECDFADGTGSLLSYELVAAAEEKDAGEICEQVWSGSALGRLRMAGPLYAGFDVARRNDFSVITVVETVKDLLFVRAILRMRGLSLPEQEERLFQIGWMHQLRCVAIDMTGIGLGLVEHAQRHYGSRLIQGINFASSVAVSEVLRRDGERRDKVRVTEVMALEVLKAYEERRVRQPADELLRSDLRKVERVALPGGGMSVAASRDESGHADHFWSLALALEAVRRGRRWWGGMEVVETRRRGVLL